MHVRSFKSPFANPFHHSKCHLIHGLIRSNVPVSISRTPFNVFVRVPFGPFPCPLVDSPVRHWRRSHFVIHLSRHDGLAVRGLVVPLALCGTLLIVRPMPGTVLFVAVVVVARVGNWLMSPSEVSK